jgi:hypothetical protein
LAIDRLLTWNGVVLLRGSGFNPLQNIFKAGFSTSALIFDSYKAIWGPALGKITMVLTEKDYCTADPWKGCVAQEKIIDFSM